MDSVLIHSPFDMRKSLHHTPSPDSGLVHSPVPSLPSSHSTSNPGPETHHDGAKSFPILSLPLEIRALIYAHLLPPRTHTIVALPPYPYFSNTLPSLPSTYPFSRQSSQTSLSTAIPKTTPYKLLSANTHRSHPHPSLHPAFLRTCKQIHAEAEGMLYAPPVVWDFGVDVGVVGGFFAERGEGKKRVGRVRVGREVAGGMDAAWESVVGELSMLGGVREVDLTVWCVGGGEDYFPAYAKEGGNSDCGSWSRDGLRGEEERDRELENKQWSEWDWIQSLMRLPTLKKVTLTWWIFREVVEEGAWFDSWRAGRMVGDKVLRERMVREGTVIQGVVVLPGLAA